MEFHQLRYFIAAAEDLSISRAAARLHVSQPALSRQVALLEEEMGVALFDRIRLAALKSERWASLSDSAFPGRREFLRQICLRAGFEPRIVEEEDSLSLMLWAVSAGECVAIIPWHTRKLPHEGCVFVALAPPVPYSELLIAMPSQEPSLELATLVSLLADRARLLGDD